MGIKKLDFLYKIVKGVLYFHFMKVSYLFSLWVSFMFSREIYKTWLFSMKEDVLLNFKVKKRREKRFHYFKKPIGGPFITLRMFDKKVRMGGLDFS